MSHHERSCRRAHSQQYESILALRMLRIVKQPAVRIVENALRLLKPDSVLGAIAPILPFVPIEPQHI